MDCFYSRIERVQAKGPLEGLRDVAAKAAEDAGAYRSHADRR
jgi:hypothetical protein